MKQDYIDAYGRDAQDRWEDFQRGCIELVIGLGMFFAGCGLIYLAGYFGLF